MMARRLFQSGSVFLTKAVSHEVFHSKRRYFWGAVGGVRSVAIICVLVLSGSRGRLELS